MEEAKDILLQRLREAQSLYCRLVLLVSENITAASRLLKQIALELNSEVLNVNLELSRTLLENPEYRVPSNLLNRLHLMLGNTSSTLILDHLDILFDKDLHLNPFHFLQQIARNRTVLAVWNGKIHHAQLIHATPGHPEYCCYDPEHILMVQPFENEERSTHEVS